MITNLTLQTPLVGPLEIRKHMAMELGRRWTQHSPGQLSGHRARALTTAQAKGKGKRKDSDDSALLATH